MTRARPMRGGWRRRSSGSRPRPPTRGGDRPDARAGRARPARRGAEPAPGGAARGGPATAPPRWHLGERFAARLRGALGIVPLARDARPARRAPARPGGARGPPPRALQRPHGLRVRRPPGRARPPAGRRRPACAMRATVGWCCWAGEPGVGETRGSPTSSPPPCSRTAPRSCSGAAPRSRWAAFEPFAEALGAGRRRRRAGAGRGCGRRGRAPAALRRRRCRGHRPRAAAAGHRRPPLGRPRHPAAHELPAALAPAPARLRIAGTYRDTRSAATARSPPPSPDCSATARWTGSRCAASGEPDIAALARVAARRRKTDPTLTSRSRAPAATRSSSRRCCAGWPRPGPRRPRRASATRWGSG